MHHLPNATAGVFRPARIFLLIWLVVSGGAYAEENASNPLAAVNNTDLRWQYFSASAGQTHDAFIEGAYMLLPVLKLKYELHYNFTNVTGTNQQDFQKVVIKPIYFPYQTMLNETWGMRAALGLDLILEFGNTKKGIGIGANQIGPFAGLAFSNTATGLALIPLVQHYLSIGGPTDVSQTAFRLIALQPFGQGFWAKLDAKIPYDWENKNWPLTAEAQLGYNVNKNVAIYVDGLLGIGTARPYNAGAGLGLRFKY